MPSLCLSQLCQQNRIIQQVNHETTVCVDEGSRDASWTSRFPIYFSFSSPSPCDCSPVHVSRTLPAFSPTERHSSLGCSSLSPLGTLGELQLKWLAQESALAASLWVESGVYFQEEKWIHFSGSSVQCGAALPGEGWQGAFVAILFHSGERLTGWQCSEKEQPSGQG